MDEEAIWIRMYINARRTSFREPVARNSSVSHEGDGDEGLEEPHGVGLERRYRVFYVQWRGGEVKSPMWWYVVESQLNDA